MAGCSDRRYNLNMLKILGLIAIFSLGLPASLAWADGPDAASMSALANTQQMLQTPDQRNKAIGESSSAQTVDAQVKSLTGNPQTTEDLYKISGSVMEDIVKESGGDPAKMMQIMSQAASNPEGFMNHLSDKNKKAIHDISTQIDTAPTTRQPTAVTPTK
jgi:hypothetical protein